MTRAILFFALFAAFLNQTEPVRLKVAAVQFRSSLSVPDNVKRINAVIEQLADQGVNVAAFPECALTGYHTGEVMEPSAEAVLDAEEQIRLTCQKKKIGAVVGSIYKTNGRTYDTAVVFNSRGELVERYGKVMLAGEKWAVPGNHVAFFELEGVPSTVIICHDERYPELVRLPAMAGAQVVYYISHEAGMEKEWKLAGYRAQMMARAVENDVFVVAANAPGNIRDNSGSHGQSRIIKNDGNVLQEGSFYGDDILVETLLIKPRESEWLAKGLKGLLADWWAEGVEFMKRNQHRKLE
jgi:predicted amidohydrolase